LYYDDDDDDEQSNSPAYLRLSIYVNAMLLYEIAHDVQVPEKDSQVEGSAQLFFKMLGVYPLFLQQKFNNF
jgi:hypothetical protein